MKTTTNNTAAFLNFFSSLAKIGFLIVLTASFTFGQKGLGFQLSSKSGPNIKWDFTTINTGKIQKANTAMASFTFINDGNSDLVISSATTMDANSHLVFSKYPIPANGGGSVDILFEAINEGPIQIPIIVTSNAGTETILLEGVVVHSNYN